MSAEDIFQVGESVRCNGRTWQVKACYRWQALLEARYPKPRARRTSRQTYGHTYTLQHYAKLEKI